MPYGRAVAAKNKCAGPFGAAYDAYIERPWLTRVLARAVWGIDIDVLYRGIRDEVGRLRDGDRVLDAPSGGGLALREVPNGVEVEYIAVDIAPTMLERTARRAAALGLSGVRTVQADMLDLPFEDGSFDVVLTYSGLHMVDRPRDALAELVRCLRPGGRLAGTTFVRDASRRQRVIFAVGERSGDAPLPCASDELRAWLEALGLSNVDLRGRGFVAFTADRR